MLNAAEVRTLADTLAPSVVGGVIQQVRQHDAETVAFEVRAAGETIHLMLSARPGRARLGASARVPEARDAPRTLVQWLRAQARGARVTHLEALGGDRAVRVVFDSGSVVGLLFGHRPTLVALDAEARVVCVVGGDVPGAVPGQAFVWPTWRSSVADEPVRFGDPYALEAEVARLDAEENWSRTTRALRAGLSRATERLRTLRRHLDADGHKHGDFERWRTLGEALKAVASRLPRGTTSVRVVDYASPDLEEIEVTLDPVLDGPGNVERYFRRYRKGREAETRLAERRVEVEARLVTLEALAADVEAGLAEIDRTAEPARIEGALAALRARQDNVLRRMGLPPTPTSKAPSVARPAAPPRLPYRVFTSRTGETIWVGRGGVDNHALTFRHARGNDFWLHARDSPGAHVVVPQPTRGRAPARETLLDAAALALHHSDLRGEPVGEVTCVLRKHVRAIRGAAPGRVSLTDAAAVTVHDAVERVTRLYGDRDGEAA
jgi:predicted ribosome quality control (RQC) complex YloA/Tae2 family protein